MISSERVRETLRAKGVDLAKVAADPRMREDAARWAYKAIPIPLRWIVGRKRVAKVVDAMAAGAGRITGDSKSALGRS